MITNGGRYLSCVRIIHWQRPLYSRLVAWGGAFIILVGVRRIAAGCVGRDIRLLVTDGEAGKVFDGNTSCMVVSAFARTKRDFGVQSELIDLK